MDYCWRARYVREASGVPAGQERLHARRGVGHRAHFVAVMAVQRAGVVAEQISDLFDAGAAVEKE